MSNPVSRPKAAVRLSGPRSGLVLILCLVVCFAAAAIGSAATLPNIQGWYEGLQKPGFTPPNALFAPVWTLLYILMAVALWRMLLRAEGRIRLRAAGIFAVQLMLNALWSVVFFGWHAIGAALAVIVLLEIAIVATIDSFRRIDRVAAWLLVPYAVWVGYASLLNLAILMLN